MSLHDKRIGRSTTYMLERPVSSFKETRVGIRSSHEISCLLTVDEAARLHSIAIDSAKRDAVEPEIEAVVNG